MQCTRGTNPLGTINIILRKHWNGWVGSENGSFSYYQYIRTGWVGQKKSKPDYVKFEWSRTEFHIQIPIWMFLHYGLRIIENIPWNCSHSKIQSRVNEVLNNILLCTNMTFYLKTKQCVVQGKIHKKRKAFLTSPWNSQNIEL